MSNWGQGYKTGYRAGVIKALRMYRADKSKHERAGSVDFLMRQIDKDDGGPSMYAVANKCCGGVDAHDVGCH